VLLLAFDTATPAVTVALHDGTAPVAAELAVDARRHGELLAPAIRRVLATAGARTADLTGIVTGTGPGPYTGLRAGLVTARVLGASLGLPVHGVCTLDIIAWDAARGGVTDSGDGQAGPALPSGQGFTVATDARRKEVYWARYLASGERVKGPEVGPPGDAGGGGPVAGEGAWLYPAELGPAAGPRYPSAAALASLAAARLAAGEDLLPPGPLYLRRPDARVPGPPKRVTP
jgi:tRNA threonylcarbamoyl adenosine modification protein YeaZ